MSNNLGGDRVTASQTQKEVPINDSLEVLDGAISEKLAVAVTSSNAKTLTAEEFYKNQTFVVDEDGGDPATAAITLTVPSTGPLPDSVVNAPRGNFNIVNDTAFDVTVTISGQSLTAPVVAAGDRALLSSDGVDVYQPAGSGGGGGSIAVEDDGSSIVASATTLNFTGAGVTVTDAGGGQADIAVPGGGASGSVEGGVLSIIHESTFSAVSQVDVTGLNPQDGDHFEIYLTDVTVSADDSDVFMRVSDDNGATFESANYQRLFFGASSGPTSESGGSTSSSVIGLTNVAGTSNGSGLGNAAGESGSWRVDLFEAADTSHPKGISFQGTYSGADGETYVANGGGAWTGGNGAVNAVRFLPESGTFSGRVVVVKRSSQQTFHTVQTTDATQTILFSVPIADGEAVTLEAVGSGFDAATEDTYHFKILAGASRTGATTRSQGVNVTELDGDVTGWDATAAINDTTDTLDLLVTGAASTTVEWVATTQFTRRGP